MENISPEFIERYQLILEREPKSRVFAPLAEAYRKMGLAHRAFSICKTGLNYHPHFAGGHIAMARTLMTLEEPQKAIEHLEKATELAPENILAHQTLAEIYLSLKMTKEALKAYKMVLFLSPDNAKAQKAVKKLESLTADEFPESLFDDLNIDFIDHNKKQQELQPPSKPLARPPFTLEKPISDDAQQKSLDRFLSLIDVFIVRNDNEKALQVYEEARLEFSNHPELDKRLKIINPQAVSNNRPESKSIPHPPPSREETKQQNQVESLRNMLFRVNKNRRATFRD
ncbi:MAG: tetratricopeptide repeat protein [Bdellovibrionales bacterium]|nr:tetratricopeptide repeat protein [Bdellovibrionales bacterium]